MMTVLTAFIIFIDMTSDTDVRATFPITLQSPTSVSGIKKMINQKIAPTSGVLSDYYLSSMDLRRFMGGSACGPKSFPDSYLTDDMVLCECDGIFSPDPSYRVVARMLMNGSTIIATRSVTYNRITGYG